MLTKGFVDKKYNRIYFAYFMGWIISLIGELSDSILSGLFISEEAVAATGLVAPIFSVIFFFASLISVGIAAKYSNYAGAFDKESTSILSGMSLIVTAFVGIVLALGLILFENLYFKFYAAAPEIEALAREYYSIFILIALITPIHWGFYNLVMVDGNETLILVADMTEAFLNMGVSLFLVQRIGIQGLALGTLISTVVTGLILLLHFLSKHNSLHFKFKMNGRLLKESLFAGSSVASNYLFVALVDIVFNKYIIYRFGDSYLPAYAVVNLVLNLSGALVCGVDAATPFIGVAYGEKNNVALHSIMKKCSRKTIMNIFLFTFIFFFGAKFIPVIYGIETPEIVELSIYTSRIISLTFVCAAFTFEFSTYYAKINKPVLSNLMVFMNTCGGPLVLATILGLFGFKAMVWGFALAPASALLCGAIAVIAKYGIKAYPYVIEENNNIILEHEFAVTPEEIIELQGILHQEMADNGLSKELSNKIELMLEETMMICREQNSDKKRILAACTVIIDKDVVRLITRDNGKIFDITQIESDAVQSLRDYVTARLMDTNKENKYMTTISFNRNTFLWQRS